MDKPETTQEIIQRKFPQIFKSVTNIYVRQVKGFKNVEGLAKTTPEKIDEFHAIGQRALKHLDMIATLIEKNKPDEVDDYNTIDWAAIKKEVAQFDHIDGKGDDDE